MLFRGGRLDAECVLVPAEGDGDGVAIFFRSLSSECTDMLYEFALNSAEIEFYIQATSRRGMFLQTELSCRNRVIFEAVAVVCERAFRGDAIDMKY